MSEPLGVGIDEPPDRNGAFPQSEAQLCANDPVLIVGGGNSAGQAAIFLSQHAASCGLIIRGGDLAKSMSRYLIDEIERRPQIELMRNREIVELKGDAALEAVVSRDTVTGERQRARGKGGVRAHRRIAARRLARRQRRE